MAEINIPQDLKYARSDEWVRVEDDIVTLGISDFAQDQLNDLTYVELREVGTRLDAGDAFGEVESVKSQSEVYTPIAGEIVEVNRTIEDEPELINSDPYGSGWMVKLRVDNTSVLAELLDAEHYRAYLDSR